MDMKSMLSAGMLLMVGAGFAEMQVGESFREEDAAGHTWIGTCCEDGAFIEDAEGMSGLVRFPDFIRGTEVGICTNFLRHNDHVTTAILSDGISHLCCDFFISCSNLTRVHLPIELESIGHHAFGYATRLKKVILPPKLREFQLAWDDRHPAFERNYGLRDLYVTGDMPAGLMEPGKPCHFETNRMYNVHFLSQGHDWDRFRNNRCYCQCDFVSCVPEIIDVRPNPVDNRALDIDYCVYEGEKPCEIRFMGFIGGKTNIQSLVEAKTLTKARDFYSFRSDAPTGRKRISWQVDCDCDTESTNVCVGILVKSGELMSGEYVKIPASEGYPTIKVRSSNPDNGAAFRAILWLYLNGEGGIERVGDELRMGKYTIASGFNANPNRPEAMEYIAAHDGYQLLKGDMLKYVCAKLDRYIVPAGTRQYFWKVVADDEEVGGANGVEMDFGWEENLGERSEIEITCDRELTDAERQGVRAGARAAVAASPVVYSKDRPVQVNYPVSMGPAEFSALGIAPAAGVDGSGALTLDYREPSLSIVGFDSLGSLVCKVLPGAGNTIYAVPGSAEPISVYGAESLSAGPESMRPLTLLGSDDTGYLSKGTEGEMTLTFEPGECRFFRARIPDRE